MALKDLKSQLGSAVDTKSTKSTKAEVNYRHAGSSEYSSDATSAKDHCGSCRYYEPDEHHSSQGTCEIVSGSIQFHDVCDEYSHRVLGGSVESGDTGSDSADQPAPAPVSDE